MSLTKIKDMTRGGRYPVWSKPWFVSPTGGEATRRFVHWNVH
jgi:hypothetical protein